MMTVVTGGSGSGKSAFAEDKILSFGPRKRIYVATMHPYDEESHKRVARHRNMRAGKGFETVECYTGLKKLDFSEDEAVLLKEFRTYLKDDPVKTDLIDMTRLGLVEVTRKKIKKSLRDSLKMN